MKLSAPVAGVDKTRVTKIDRRTAFCLVPFADSLLNLSSNVSTFIEQGRNTNDDSELRSQSFLLAQPAYVGRNILRYHIHDNIPSCTPSCQLDIYGSDCNSLLQGLNGQYSKVGTLSYVRLGSWAVSRRPSSGEALGD